MVSFQVLDIDRQLYFLIYYFSDLDKSGFLSGLVNHGVSAAMRSIMKVFGTIYFVFRYLMRDDTI